MHHLFGLVLAQKDLSRAGDLFSLEDAEIEGSLSEALEQIRIISSAADYQTNDNDQAVVEICITRITTAIRATASIERHGRALVALWESCLEHNLKPSGKDEDAPHAKIASDIMSCILQNYNRPPVMALAVPVAVKFLQRGNKELCRNMSSYLSLAAIAKAELLAEHTETILRSVLQGEDNGFVQGLGHLEPDAGSEGAQGHARGRVDTPKDLPGAHGEQDCGFTAWKGGGDCQVNKNWFICMFILFNCAQLGPLTLHGIIKVGKDFYDVVVVAAPSLAVSKARLGEAWSNLG
uniref:Ventricular zone expressed PH domain containing 1 n=1 Tax=Zosterops lateralis melanops TaxID=1220523 RepID=A0A8D2P215_ZOSLA